jgi:predicted RecB family nuclease
MRGSFSLKNLIHAIDPELSYESLAISHGIQAVLHYRNLSDEEDDGITREALLSYCHMDTFAMVKVFEWLKTLI